MQRMYSLFLAVPFVLFAVVSGPVRPSVYSPAYFFFARGRLHRRASSFATSKPMLWRVRA